MPRPPNLPRAAKAHADRLNTRGRHETAAVLRRMCEALADAEDRIEEHEDAEREARRIAVFSAALAEMQARGAPVAEVEALLRGSAVPEDALKRHVAVAVAAAMEAKAARLDAAATEWPAADPDNVVESARHYARYYALCDAARIVRAR